MASNVKKDLPRDALVMQAILQEMGVKDYEPRLVNIMLEFSYSKLTILVYFQSIKKFLN